MDHLEESDEKLTGMACHMLCQRPIPCLPISASFFVLPGVAPAGAASTETLSFLGVSFTTERISRVRITTGNSSLGPNDGGELDLVVMDDFIYSEPQVVPEPTTLFLLGSGLLGLAGISLRRSRK